MREFPRIHPALTQSAKSHISSFLAPTGLSITMHGQPYPSGSDNAKDQTFNLKLICDENASDPKFVSYDGSLAEVEWTNPAACGSEVGDGSDNDNGNDGDSEGDEEEESVGSGIGWFFLVYAIARARLC